MATNARTRQRPVVANGGSEERNKGGRPKKVEQAISGLSRYLDEARGDRKMALDLVKVGKRIGVTDDTIRAHAKTTPEIRRLLDDFDTLADDRAKEQARLAAATAAEEAEHATGDGEARMAAPPEAGAGPDAGSRPTLDGLRAAVHADAAAALSADGLRRQIVHLVREIEAVMLGYAGRCRRERDERNVRRVAYDLDEALGRLHRLQAKLTPLAAEYRRRDRATLVGAEERDPVP